jgi:hypothetical protein
VIHDELVIPDRPLYPSRLSHVLNCDEGGGGNLDLYFTQLEMNTRLSHCPTSQVPTSVFFIGNFLHCADFFLKKFKFEKITRTFKNIFQNLETTTLKTKNLVSLLLLAQFKKNPPHIFHYNLQMYLVPSIRWFLTINTFFITFFFGSH